MVCWFENFFAPDLSVSPVPVTFFDLNAQNCPLSAHTNRPMPAAGLNDQTFSQEELLNFAKRDAQNQGHKLQTEYTFMDNLEGFYHAVSWSNDKWIFCIFALQFTLLCFVIATRSADVYFQGMLFGLLVALAAGASPLNALAHKNWESFSTQNYFDRRGTFASVIWTGPFILILLLQLLLMVKLTANLAVKAGRLRVRDNIRKKSQQKRNGKEKDGEAGAGVGKDDKKKKAQ